MFAWSPPPHSKRDTFYTTMIALLFVVAVSALYGPAVNDDFGDSFIMPFTLPDAEHIREAQRRRATDACITAIDVGKDRDHTGVKCTGDLHPGFINWLHEHGFSVYLTADHRWKKTSPDPIEWMVVWHEECSIED